MILFFKVVSRSVDDALKENDFVKEFKVRFKTPFNLLNSPYSKKLLFVDPGGVYAFLLEIAWFKFYILGFIGLAGCIIFHVVWAWYIIPAFMSLMCLFWVPDLYLLMFKLALRKKGFRGKVHKLSAEAFCEKVLIWGR